MRNIVSIHVHVTKRDDDDDDDNNNYLPSVKFENNCNVGFGSVKYSNCAKYTNSSIYIVNKTKIHCLLVNTIYHVQMQFVYLHFEQWFLFFAMNRPLIPKAEEIKSPNRYDAFE